MPSLSRSQLLVYGALGVAILLLGVRWIRSADADGAQPDAIAFHGAEVAAGSDSGAGSADIVVHVAGAVKEPGVYRFPDGARVGDAVKRAGGTTADGAPDAVNLAAELADGQQVVVPAGAAGGSVALVPGGSSGPISLGSATVEQLDTIEGIGPVTAQSIVDFRAENGGVSSVEDLDQISGIGPATMEALRAALQP